MKMQTSMHSSSISDPPDKTLFNLWNNLSQPVEFRNPFFKGGIILEAAGF